MKIIFSFNMKGKLEFRSKKEKFFCTVFFFFFAPLLCAWLECSNFISGGIRSRSTTQSFFYTWLLTDALDVTERLAETCQPRVCWL